MLLRSYGISPQQYQGFHPQGFLIVDVVAHVYAL